MCDFSYRMLHNPLLAGRIAGEKKQDNRELAKPDPKNTGTKRIER